MWQVFLVVNPSTRGFLLSGEVSSDRYAAVTCTPRMKKAQWISDIEYLPKKVEFLTQPVRKA